MAEVEEIPQDLRALARRIDPLVRAGLSPWELELRCSYAASLAGEAESCGDERKADRLRREASKILGAMPADALSAESARLNQEMSEANARGDSRAAYEAFSDLHRLERNQPQVPADYVMSAAAAAVVKTMEARLKAKIPPPPSSRLFSRKHGRK